MHCATLKKVRFSVFEDKIFGGRATRKASGRVGGLHPFCNVTSVYRVNVLKLVAEICTETPKAEVTRQGGPITCIDGCADLFCISVDRKLRKFCIVSFFRG